MTKEIRRLVVFTQNPLNAETPAEIRKSAITPSSSYFVRGHFPIPTISDSEWRLEVGGEVRKPRSFTFAELRKMPQRNVLATTECAGNGRIGFPTAAKGELRWGDGALSTARWTGVPLRRVLKLCGPKDSANQVVTEGSDSGKVEGQRKVNYSRALPLDKAMDENTIIALGMNGRRIPAEHGGPVRLMVPGWYGMASVKWLSTVRLASGEPYTAPFNGVKYVYLWDEGGREVREPVTEMRVKSVISYPAEGELLSSGRPVTVTGKAWSGSGRITRVEVDLGDGWEEARLGGDRRNKFAWVPWTKVWRPKQPGSFAISSRATDEKGNVQPVRPFENKLQYGYNAIQTVRVEVRQPSRR